jgi:hypothetical protein
MPVEERDGVVISTAAETVGPDTSVDPKTVGACTSADPETVGASTSSEAEIPPALLIRTCIPDELATLTKTVETRFAAVTFDEADKFPP